MGQTFSIADASGATTNKQIKIAATSTPGTNLHQNSGGAGVYDEVWVYASNSSDADVQITIEFGGTSSPDDNVIMVIKAKAGPYLVIPGWRLHDGLTVKAFAATANVLTCKVEVNRAS